MNNKGYSLVELIVSVAILTIITSAILGFIVTGTKSYGNVSEDVDLQQEAQLSMNQLGDIIIDSTNGLKYYYNDNEANTVLSDADIAGDPTSKTFAIYNTVKETVSGVTVEKKYIYNLIWKSADKKIYFRKDSIADATGAVTVGTEELMAEYVSIFSPSLVKVEDKKKVSMTLTFSRNDKTYTSSKNFAIRNKTVVNGQITDIYDDITETLSAVTSVVITHNNIVEPEVTLWKSEGTLTFGKNVTGTGFPSSEVTWSLSGSTSSVAGEESGSTVTTTPTGCTVTLGPNEASGSLSLVAISKAPAADGSLVSSDPVVIKIKDITSVGLSMNGTPSGEYFKNDTFTVTASVMGTNSLTSDDKRVKWTVSGAQRTSDYPEDSLVQNFRVTADKGAKVNVSATSAFNSSCTASIQEITVKGYDLNIYPSNEVVLNVTNNTCELSVSVSPDENPKPEIVWEIGETQYTYGGAAGRYAVITEQNSSRAKILYKDGDKLWNHRVVVVTAYVKNHPEIKATKTISIRGLGDK